MDIYSVSKLAKMASVSVRTLHHYDEIGLLKPSFRSDAGYRQYQREDLLRLQQVLFYRELDFSLNEIKEILGNPDHDEVQALTKHRKCLVQRIKRFTNLLNTLDKTLLHYKENTMALTDKELYEGFSKEQIELYNKEVDEKYDPELVKISKERIGKMSKGQWKEIKAEGENIAREMAEIIDLSPESDDVQKLVKRQHTWIENFYPANAETFKGLGKGYTENPEFREFYDKYKPGLADFLCLAMEYFADMELSR